MPGFFEVSELRQSFGGIIAVDGLSISVAEGELFGIIGPNGAGKTTFLNSVCGLYRNTTGSATIGRDELIGLRPYQVTNLGVARTMQAADFFAGFRALDFLLLSRLNVQRTSLIPCMMGLPHVRRSELNEFARAQAMLERFGLSDVAHEHLAGLPYGTRKLLDLCRALLAGPRLLLLDEPTSGTAAADRELLRAMLAELRGEGLTTVVVDHDVAFISEVSDRLLAMSFGKPLAIGRPDEVLARPDVIESYVGIEQ